MGGGGGEALDKAWFVGEDQLMHKFLDNFHQGGKYSAEIASHQAELRREENLLIKNIYLFHPYRMII